MLRFAWIFHSVLALFVNVHFQWIYLIVVNLSIHKNTQWNTILNFPIIKSINKNPVKLLFLQFVELKVKNDLNSRLYCLHTHVSLGIVRICLQEKSQMKNCKTYISQRIKCMCVYLWVFVSVCAFVSVNVW